MGQRHTAAERLFERALLGMLVSGFLALASTGELSPVVLGLSVAGFTARVLLLIFQRSLTAPPHIAPRTEATA